MFASWQSGLLMAMNVGQVLGLLLNGLVAERLGYRKTMMGSLVLVMACIFLLFFAHNKEMLLVGELLMGIPLGASQTLSVTYASEVCPVVLRVSSPLNPTSSACDSNVIPFPSSLRLTSQHM